MEWDLASSAPILPCGGAVTTPLDDEHNTSNCLLSACAPALGAPALLSGLTEPDELAVALWCRFAFDMWTTMQQVDLPADQESTASSDSLVLLSFDPPCEPDRTGGRA